MESKKTQISAHTAEAFVFQAQVTGSAAVAHVYIASGSQASSVVVGVYTSAAGHPGALLGSTTLTNAATSSWNTTVITATPLVSGTIYWIAVLPIDNKVNIEDHIQDSTWTSWFNLHGSYMAETSQNTTLNALPAIWATGTTPTEYNVSAYLST